jgi:hypothetical protein
MYEYQHTAYIMQEGFRGPGHLVLQNILLGQPAHFIQKGS